MRLLLDESVPAGLRRSLTDHSVKTTVEMGWGGVKNGLLLALAAKQFDAFLTVFRLRTPAVMFTHFTSRLRLRLRLRLRSISTPRSFSLVTRTLSPLANWQPRL